jgi:NADH-quinone oxidoreductase subunit B
MALEFLTTKKDELVGWIRKFSLFPYPFVTACCGMEFMSVASTIYDTDRFGAALPRFTPRQSDLLMVVGTITHKEAPVVKKVYDQMCDPKWVMAFGACPPAAASTATTPWCRAWTRSSRSTSTCPAARRARRW